MRLFVSKILMFFVLLLMLIQPVQAKANDLKVDDAYVCMQATAKIEQQYQIKKHLLTTIWYCCSILAEIGRAHV